MIKFELYNRGNDGEPILAKIIESDSMEQAISEFCGNDIDPEYVWAIPVTEPSPDYGVSKIGGYGLGTIEKGANDYQCSKYIASQKSLLEQGKGQNVSTAFALVEHPQYGVIAVSEIELEHLDLPEISGFPA